MIRTIANVIRGEGVASAFRRTAERIGEALQPRFAADAPLVNYCATPVAARNGGVAIQLMTRLREERNLRAVALNGDLRAAKAVHLEGTANAPLDDLLTLNVPLIVSIHDFTLFDHPLAQRVLDTARATIFPSHFLLHEYRRRFRFAGEVIEPAILSTRASSFVPRTAVAFAGSVKPHKGGALLPELARRIDRELHVFGGGDLDLLLPLRRTRNARVHGYYRHATLPALLARHRVGLVVLPSIVPESFSLTLSAAWMAGAYVVAFDHGAIAERIRAHGGGALAPLASGAEGLSSLIKAWRGDEPVPAIGWTPADAARAHVALYRRLGLL